MIHQTTFRWHIYAAIFVPKITGIGQLLLKLSLVVGWYPFFETQCIITTTIIIILQIPMSKFIMPSSCYGHCKSSLDSPHTCMFSDRRTPTVRPSQPIWAVSLPACCYRPLLPSLFITRRPASAEKTARAANFRRHL